MPGCGYFWREGKSNDWDKAHRGLLVGLTKSCFLTWMVITGMCVLTLGYAFCRHVCRG